MKHLFIATAYEIQAHIWSLGKTHWIDIGNGECVALSERAPPAEMICHRCPHLLRNSAVGVEFAGKTAHLGVLPTHTTLDAIETLGRVNPLFTVD